MKLNTKLLISVISVLVIGISIITGINLMEKIKSNAKRVEEYEETLMNTKKNELEVLVET